MSAGWISSTTAQIGLKFKKCYPQCSECLLGRSCSNVHVHLNDPGPTITCHNNLVTHFYKYCPDQIAHNLKSQIQYNSISTNRSQGNLTHVLRRRFLNTIIFFCAELTSGENSSKVKNNFIGSWRNLTILGPWSWSW